MTYKLKTALTSCCTQVDQNSIQPCIERGKQTDIDGQEANDEQDEWEDVGNVKNVKTDLVHDSKPIASIFLEYF